MTDNTLATAFQITGFPFVKTEFVGSTDTIDYYRFTLDQNGVLGTQMSGTSITIITSLIKDFDKDNGIDTGETIDRFFTSSGESDSQDLQVDAGEYFLEVQRSISSGETNYSLTLNFNAVPATTGGNPGNNLATALNVGSLTSESKILKEYVGETDTSDYYRFTLDQNANFGWQFRDIDATTRVRLIKDFDNDGGIDSGEIVDEDFASTGSDLVLNQALEAGDYFIEVIPSLDGNNTNYTLQLDYDDVPKTTESNPGNDLNNALNIGSLNNPKVLTDFIGFTDDVDVYKFTLDTNLKLNWKTSDLVQTARFDLIQDLDRDGGIDSGETLDTEFSNSEASFESDLAAGDYFIRVSKSLSSTSTNYTLTLSSPNLNIPPVTQSPLISSFTSGEIGTINTSTGAFTSLGTNTTSFLDIALSADQKLFGVSGGGLYRVNFATNTSVSIGDLGGVNINALDFTSDGTLYGTGSSGFYRIDTTTGQATLVANIANFNSDGDLVFNTANNQFLATSTGSNGSTLFSIALDGIATRIGDIGFSNVFGLFGANGSLFGYTSDGKQISINAATGAGTLSANVTGISGQIGGAAALPTSLPTPAPATAILDADGDGKFTFAQDALVISAFGFFYRADRTDYTALNKFITNPNATRKTGDAVANFLKDKISSLDADGDGKFTFAQDGLAIAATAFFYRADRTDYTALNKFITNPNATRKTGDAVVNYLKPFIPVAAGSASASVATAEDLNGNSIDLIGTPESDILVGDADNNFIAGGVGDDTLTGGEGKDTFSFGIDSGKDKITDFQVGSDLIQLDRSLGFADSNAVLAAVNYRDSAAELILSEGNILTIEIDRPLTLDNFVIV